MSENKLAIGASFLDNKEMREQYISRIEVLDKVKKLFLLPQMECMTIRQLSDYYDVGYETIKSRYKRNQDEFDEDGVTFKKPSDFKILNGSERTVKNMNQQNGKLVITLTDSVKIVIPNRGIKCFPKRAILRMAMLLQGSETAKEIRTQLLNITEKVIEEEPEKATEEIETELNLMQNIMSAFNSGDINELLTSACKMNAFKERHILKLKDELEIKQEENKELAESNNILAGDILKWSNRSSASAVVRIMAKHMRLPYSAVWGLIYKELLYKHGINVKQRGDRKPPYIKHLQKEEWRAFFQSAAAIMQTNNIEPSQVFKQVARSTRVKRE